MAIVCMAVKSMDGGGVTSELAGAMKAVGGGRKQSSFLLLLTVLASF